MTIYISEPVEIEAMQWHKNGGNDRFLEPMAREIIAWVNANGGEAQLSHPFAEAEEVGWPRPRIWLRTADGEAVALPGDYVVMGETRFQVRREVDPASQMSAMVTVREFYPVRDLSDVRVDHKWRVK